MHPALSLLLNLKLRGNLRRYVRGLKTLRGVLFFTAGLGMIALWVGPAFVAALVGPRYDPLIFRNVAPFALLAMCVIAVVTSVGEAAIYFAPSEVDFLLAGPFRRRDLLVYKLLSKCGGTLFSALLLSVFVLRGATWWIAVYTGIFLALMFVQLVAMVFILVRQMVAELAYTKARKLAVSVAVGLAAVGSWQAWQAGAGDGLITLLHQFRTTLAGYCLLAPFDVFGRTITAQSLFPEFVGWAAFALAIDLILVGLVIRLDADYLEAAVAISQKIYARMEQRRRRGGLAGLGEYRATRWRVPVFPWLGGAGPIAWRQFTSALRGARTLLLLLLILAAVSGPGLISLGPKGVDPPDSLVWLLLGGVAWMALWFTVVIPFDFRTDLDHIAWLKMLPVSPVAIVVGQLTVPAGIFSLLQIILFCGFGIVVPTWRHVLAAAAIFTFPFNFLLFGTENLLFLLFPTRIVGSLPGDFQTFGRQMLLFLMKMPLVLICCAVAACLGAVAFWLTGQSWLAFVAVSWVGLVILAAVVVPYLTWAFVRFDVSLDTPA